ncbi:hypothetical protein DFH08DRAFT_1042423 [Mycena albidolilacea]|uniref:Uncharacterized protein n=1 Tax=Mycena albidolilacea TaxID=1033008 RepID=A0AAD6Z9M9_9AGAR|nr:hypothetical protein DFH08DRAFT_1042423 [Mycena albidolilacea]
MQGLYDETAQVFAVQSLSVPPRCIYNALPWQTRPFPALVDPPSGVGLHRRPFTEPHRETPRRSPVTLPLACTIPPLPSPMMSWPPCAVVETMSWVLTHSRDSPGLALKRTSTASTTTPRARAQPRATLARRPNVAPLRHPTVQLKARLPPRTSAVRTLASLTVTLSYAPATPSTALGSMQTHRFAYRSRAFYPQLPHAPRSRMRNSTTEPCPPTFPPVSMYVRLTIDGAALRRPSRAPPRDLSAVPSMHDAAASIIVCSRRRRQGRARNGQRPSRRPHRPSLRSATPTPHAANPIAHGYDRASASRDNPAPPRNAITPWPIGNMGVANGSHTARTRAGAIRAKVKDDWSGVERFHGRLTHGSTPASRPRMRMSPPPVFETRVAHNSVSHPVPWSPSTSAR